MLRTNLATRPFYNERGVYMVLAIVTVVGLVALGTEVLGFIDLSRRNAVLTAGAEGAELAATDLSARAAEIQRAVSPQALEEVAAAAREANLLIDQRVFSWTDFFNRIETTLPPDVMLTEVRPDIEPGSVEVTMGVIGRRLDDIDEFIGALEASGAFAEVLNTLSEINEDAMYRAQLRGRYLQAIPPGGAEEDAASAALADGAAEDGDQETGAASEPADPNPDDGTTLPDADGEPPPTDDDTDPESDTDDGGPPVVPEPTPVVPAGDPS